MKPIVVYCGGLSHNIYASRHYTFKPDEPGGTQGAFSFHAKDDVTKYACDAVADHIRGCRGCDQCKPVRDAAAT